jgi:predicted ATPase with chaperone activity
VSEFDAGGDIVLYMSQLNLSARAYHRILKLSRTIADLSGIEEIQSAHLTEALHASQPPEIDAACLISAH